MFDFSDITRFATQLNSSIELVEEGWQTEWANKVADEMRSSAPVDSGRLRASIQATSDGVQVGVDYAVYVEYGTSNMAPQPFAGPATNRLVRPAAEDAGRRVIRLLT